MDHMKPFTLIGRWSPSAFALRSPAIMIGVILAVAGTSIANGGQHKTVLQSSGAWMAVRAAHYFADIATSNGGDHHVAMILPENSKHFVIALFGGLSVTKGTSTRIQFSFDTGKAFLMIGGSPHNNLIVARLPSNLVAPWTHALTAGSTMVVGINGPEGQKWNFSLSGSSPTISSMAQAIEQAGITGLPEPWTMTEFDAQQDNRQAGGPTTSSPPAAQPVEGYIGIEYEKMTPALANALGVGNSLDASQGVVVTNVLPNSPSKIAGVKAGDIIFAFGSHPIDGPSTLRRRVKNEPIGSTIQLKIIRDHRVKTISIICGRRPGGGS